MQDLVRLEIIMTKAEAEGLMDVIQAGNDRERFEDSAIYEAIDDIHTELFEATAGSADAHGFQNRIVLTPTAFPLYDRGK